MRKDSGFTLIELIVVIAVIAIVASIAIPNMIPWPAKHRMSGAAREIYSVMQYTRLMAVKEKANVVIIFNTAGFGETDTYAVFIDDGRGAGGDARDNIQNGTEPTIKSGQMPVDVDMSNALFNGNTFTGFDARGLPIQAGGSFTGAVRLSNPNRNLYRRVRLRVSGNPIIERSADGNSPWK